MFQPTPQSNSYGRVKKKKKELEAVRLSLKYLEVTDIKGIARKNWKGKSISVWHLFNIPLPSLSDYGVRTNTNKTFHSERMRRTDVLPKQHSMWESMLILLWIPTRTILLWHIMSPTSSCDQSDAVFKRQCCVFFPSFSWPPRHKVGQVLFCFFNLIEV